MKTAKTWMPSCECVKKCPLCKAAPDLLKAARLAMTVFHKAANGRVSAGDLLDAERKIYAALVDAAVEAKP